MPSSLFWPALAPMHIVMNPISGNICWNAFGSLVPSVFGPCYLEFGGFRPNIKKTRLER